MLNMEYNAAVIGLGQIGMGYDYQCCTDEKILTHCSAYHSHKGFNLCAAVDSDIRRCDQFSEKYHLPAYKNIDDLFSNVSPDVISIATPTDSHYQVFKELLPYKPKAILCEKPGSYSCETLQEMIELAKKNNILFLVNYMRRYEPGVNELRRYINDGSLGEIKKVIVKYTNGFINSASHFINLLQYIFEEVSILPISRKLIKIDDIDALFVEISDIDYAFYEVEFIGKKGVLRYYDAGQDIRIQLSQQSTNFGKTQVLSNQVRFCETDYLRFQWHVIDYLYSCLSKKIKNVMDASGAVATWRVLQECLNEESFVE